MSEHTPSEQALNNPSVHSEPTDLSFRGVALFGVGLAVVLVVVAVGSWGILNLMAARDAQQKKADYAWPREETRSETASPARHDQSHLPPLPRLEGFEPAPRDGSAYKYQVEREQRHLDEYGWVDRNAGVAHIPIQEAMRKTASRLKARQGKDVDEFLQAPSGSSSGRMPRGGTK